jgi:hypothetical protein
MDFLKGVSNAAYGVLGQVSNLTPIYDAIVKGEWFKVNPIALGLAIKEQKYQYDELLKEIGSAMIYKKKIDKYLSLIPPNELEKCAKHHFDKTYSDFSTLLESLISTNPEKCNL